MPEVRLKSSDGKIIVAEEQIIQCSKRIKGILAQAGPKRNENEIVASLNVKSDILSKVLEWAEFHKDDVDDEEEDIEQERELHEGRLYEIPYWDEHFFTLNQSSFVEIIAAAHYMKINRLMNSASKKVANMIKGKTPEQIRQIFSLKNDFTAAQEKLILKEKARIEKRMRLLKKSKKSELHFKLFMNWIRFLSNECVVYTTHVITFLNKNFKNFNSDVVVYEDYIVSFILNVK